MASIPSASILDQAFIRPQHPGALHQQVRQFLREAIDEHFEDGQSFWTEMLLMERLGVSRGTVRQALGELAAEGLLVREASRRTFVQKSGLTSIGVVLRRYESDFYVELIQHVASACLERKLHLELYPIVHDSQIDRVLDSIRRPPPEERLVLVGTHQRADKFLQECLADRGYRTVAIEIMDPGYPGSSVSTDGALAVRTTVDHLCSLGHKRIAYMVNEPSGLIPVQCKIRQFEELVEAMGLEGRTFTEPPESAQGSFEVGYGMMPAIWEWQPTAIFTASDPGAWAALRWLAEQGVPVPDQVSVVGFEGVKPDAFTHPPLTTVAHAMDELVKAAFGTLWRPLPEVRHELVAPRLVVRQSTGKAPGTKSLIPTR